LPTDVYANNPSATLAAAVTATQTSWSVTIPTPAAGAAWPTLGTNQQFRCLVDSELVIVTAGTTTAGTQTWTVIRGAEGTTAATHSSGAAIAQDLTAGALNNLTSQVPFLSALSLGMVGDGTTDNTSAINNAITTYYSTGALIYFPPGTYRVNGQIVGPADNSGPITFLGAGNGYTQSPYLTPGSVLDLRWDGGVTSTSKDQFVNDYAVVQGLAVSFTYPSASSFAVSAGYAYVNNASISTAPVSIPAVASTSVATWANGDYFIDISTTGAVTKTGPMTFTDPGNESTTTWNWAPGNTKIRIARVTVSGGLITYSQDLRSVAGKIDCRGDAQMQFINLGFTCGSLATQADEVPFIKATRSLINVDNCAFRGNKGSTTNSHYSVLAFPPTLDCVVMGGTGRPADFTSGNHPESIGPTAYSVSDGQGSRIFGCHADRIRRLAHLRGAADQMHITNNSVYNQCGAGPGGAAIEIDAVALDVSGMTTLTGNWVEAPFYAWAVKLTNWSMDNTIVGISCIDSNDSYLAAALSSTATTMQIQSPSTTYDPNLVAWLGRPCMLLNYNAWDIFELVYIDPANAVTGTALSSPANVSSATAGSNTVTLSTASTTIANGSYYLLGSTLGRQEMVYINSGAGTTSLNVTSLATASGVLAYSYSTGDAIVGAPYTFHIKRSPNAKSFNTGDAATISCGVVRSESPTATNTNTSIVGANASLGLPYSDALFDANSNNETTNIHVGNGKVYAQQVKPLTGDLYLTASTGSAVVFNYGPNPATYGEVDFYAASYLDGSGNQIPYAGFASWGCAFKAGVNIGFFGVGPAGQYTSHGAISAGTTYTSNEQNMLNDVYKALRSYGLLS
jgi:hypothetical protein